MTSAAVDTEAVAVETRAASRPRRRKRRAKPSRIALHAFLILTVLVWASPILWAIFTAMRPYSDTSEHGYVSWPRAFNFTNFTNAYSQSGMLHYFWNSIIVAIPAIFVILLFSSAARVRRLSVQLLVQRPPAHLLHGGEPSAAAGRPPAAVSPLPVGAAADLALGERVPLRLVRRPDRDQRGVPDRLLHVRARQLHEDHPEIAERGGPGRRRGRPPPVLLDHAAALQARARCARDPRVHVHLQRFPVGADPRSEQRCAADHGGAEQSPGSVLHRQQPARRGSAVDRDPDARGVRPAPEAVRQGA